MAPANAPATASTLPPPSAAASAPTTPATARTSVATGQAARLPAQTAAGAGTTLPAASSGFATATPPAPKRTAPATASFPTLAPLPGEWPQVQGNAARTGYSPEKLGKTFKVAWVHPFQPEKVYPQVQAIVADSRVFVGTEMGTLYALDARDGKDLWAYHIERPILASVAAAGGRVFFAGMDGAAYALDAATGALVWRNQLSVRLGISTAPVLADGKLLLGGRDGIFYALDPGTGKILWRFNAGAPLLQTAAWDAGTAYFGSMDVVLHAVRTADGQEVWHKGPLPGTAFKDYWPVVTQGYVVIRSMGQSNLSVGFPFVWFTTAGDWNWLRQNGTAIAAGQLTSVSDAVAAEDKLMAGYELNPDRYTRNFFVFEAATGNEILVPHWSGQTMNGASVPPCVDRDGKLIVPITFIKSAWGRLDLRQRRIVDILYDGFIPTNTGVEQVPGTGNPDENLDVSCTVNQVLAMHTEEGNASYTGSFDLEARKWTAISPGHKSPEMSTNTQGGGGNPASIAGGMVFHISWHQLIARSTH